MSTNLWSQALTSNTKAHVKPTKKIIYKNPEFQVCFDQITDEFWIHQLTNIARGKVPSGFAYANGIITHKKKKVSIQLPSDAHGMTHTYMAFLREYGNIYSPIDLEINKINSVNTCQEELSMVESWKNINKVKNVRALYIRDYVNTKYAHLSKSVKNDIYTEINTYFELDYLKSQDVEYNDGRISHIHRFEVIDGHVVPTHTFYPPQWVPLNSTPGTSVEKQYRHHENWSKYMGDYMKHICNLPDQQTATTPGYSISEDTYENSSSFSP